MLTGTTSRSTEGRDLARSKVQVLREGKVVPVNHVSPHGWRTRSIGLQSAAITTSRLSRVVGRIAALRMQTIKQ